MSTKEHGLTDTAKKPRRERMVAGKVGWMVAAIVAVHTAGCDCGRIYFTASANCGTATPDTRICLVHEADLSVDMVALSHGKYLVVRIFVENDSSDTLYVANADFQVGATDSAPGLPLRSTQGYGACRTDRDGVVAFHGASTVELIFDMKGVSTDGGGLVLSGTIRKGREDAILGFESVRIDLLRFDRIKCA